MERTRRCLVFGGSGTLGRVVCEQLSQAGAKVAFTYNTGRQVAEELVSRHPEMEAQQLDLTQGERIGEAVRKACHTLGGLDAFVHCAAVGVAPGGMDRPAADFPRITEITAGEWDRVLAVNARSVLLAAPAVAAAMGGDGGNIVLVGSIDGIKTVPAPVHYAASKGALAAMTRALAKELGRGGIRVNLLAPGVIGGGLSSSIPSRYRDQYLEHCALGRVAAAPEIAGLIVWLALDNTYLSGECVVADGGL
jgi:3-oxoacyl-[acyl-carrier protein] reductase